MNDEEKGAIDEIANALEMINRLSSRLRQGLGESAQQATKNTSRPPVRSAVALTLTFPDTSEAGLRLPHAALR